MPNGIPRAFLYSVYLIIVTLVTLEMGVRIWGYSERHIYDPVYTSFARSNDIPYIYKPNLVQARARGLAIINTDSLGLRGKVSGMQYGAKRPHEFRIAITGDSFTFGEGVPRTEDTFAQVLEQTLNDRQRIVAVKVFNYGVSAYSVKQMAATLEHRMVDIDPDLVILAMIPPDFNLSRTPVMDSRGYLADRRVAFLPDSPVRDVLRKVHLLYILRDVVLHWFPAPQDSAVSLSRGKIPESYQYIQKFKEVAEQRRLPYLIVLIPDGENTWGPLTDHLTQDSITYVDLSHLSKEFTREQYMASRVDGHASPAVHHRIGEALADYVQHQLGNAQ